MLLQVEIRDDENASIDEGAKLPTSAVAAARRRRDGIVIDGMAGPAGRMCSASISTGFVVSFMASACEHASHDRMMDGLE